MRWSIFSVRRRVDQDVDAVSTCLRHVYMWLQDADFDWSEELQGVILSSFYYGYVLSHFPGGWLAERCGGKHTLGLGVLSTALTTLLTPLAAHQGPGYLIALRVIMGLGEVGV